ncbi:MAG: molybdopterin-dependent oxidoreductase, partial [Candidatus Eremiobacteraeota bacterium]|nr:molybdopterin-dependent oxidoreductase [Candidatus Eremiobacteraeota bacterium]
TAALERTPFIVLSELFLTDTARFASLVLPAHGPFERDGHVLDMTGRVQRLFAAHAAPGGALSDGEMLVALADALDIEIPSPSALTARARAPEKRAMPRGEIRAAAPGGEAALRVIIRSDIFAGGGTVYHDERLEELRPRPIATLHPRTAQALGVAAGDLVDVIAGDRALRGLIVRVADAASEGTIRVVDGLPGAPANVLFDGEEVQVTKLEPAAPLAAAGAVAG